MGFPPMTPQTEREFQTDVLRLAAMFDWRVFHTFDSRRSAPGFPDLVLIRPPRVIFAELKAPGGRVRPEQALWLHDLDQCPGVESYLWRPEDLQFVAATLGADR